MDSAEAEGREEEESTRRHYAMAIGDAFQYSAQQALETRGMDSDGTAFSCAATKRPSVGIQSYLWDRLAKYIKASKECLALSAVLADRCACSSGQAQTQRVVLTARSVHRVLATSLVMAQKFLEDKCYLNSYYAAVVGVPVEELNALELDMLTRLDFRLWVSESEMSAYTSLLDSIMRGVVPSSSSSSSSSCGRRVRPCPVSAAAAAAAAGSSASWCEVEEGASVLKRQRTVPPVERPSFGLHRQSVHAA
jgi:hypothetical protein